MSSKQQVLLSLLFGLLLGLTLSTIIFYPNKISGAIFSERIKKNINENIRLRDTSHLTLYNESLANELYNKVRILCWVVTIPENHKTKAIHVKNTWGKRCNKLLFISSQDDLELETIPLAVSEGRSTLWDKTRTALQYIYKYHSHEADWFLKADDDSYFLIENLRYVLAQYSPKTSLYLGHRFASKFVDMGYMAGGGYILSKKILKKFVTKIMHDKNACKIENYGAEDLELGSCLKNFTIYADTRDSMQQQRFFPVGVYEHFKERDENSSFWYNDMMYYDATFGGLNCCSDTFVNAHYVFPKGLYLMDYLIYNVHPFGLQKNLTEKIPRKFTFAELVQRSDVESNATDFEPHTIYRNLDESEKFKR
ncbi:hypothetical protein PVAND_004638 [Polypedilum vanderplanki]|uniref:Glycoprotein-N-acetylgalactosamine 3-beta-galactosyltransferase 1 n=1 Tax=Polypedilum vanderplanki TaxID=319348 RepID=A0A9J6BZP7_POLVA|nr:hypothetical protein PVAND_004638 [Polypedilum vanderplanki]